LAQNGYCRRGIVALAENRPVGDVLAIVERSCALAGAAHRLALCEAIEASTKTAVPRRARLMRVLFAEAARALARLWLLALMARAAELPSLLRHALGQREALFDALETATGERVYWGVAVPGGVRDGLEVEPLRTTVEQMVPTCEVWRGWASSRGPLGRAGTAIGTMTEARANELGLSGIVARAAGAGRDLRQAAPSTGYGDLAYEWEWPDANTATGDVAARAAFAAQDLATSIGLMRACMDSLLGTSETPEASDTSSDDAAADDAAADDAAADDAAAGNNAAPVTWASGQEGQATVEGPHGPVTVGVRLASDERIAHLVLEPPGAALLEALPELLMRRAVGQVPLIVASLDLCLECVDL
jgi:Ni,Fe-hydrogenase III large subunit